VTRFAKRLDERFIVCLRVCAASYGAGERVVKVKLMRVTDTGDVSPHEHLKSRLGQLWVALIGRDRMAFGVGFDPPPPFTRIGKPVPPSPKLGVGVAEAGPLGTV
jgi:hypothetical protein